MSRDEQLDTLSIDLRIIPTNTLLSHEEHDRQRYAPLIRHLKADGCLKNPPIVTPSGLDDGNYVMLDGANRIYALAALDISHALVQVVPYEEPQIELLTWHHVICDIPQSELCDNLSNIKGIEVEAASLPHARGMLAARAILAYCVTADEHVLMLAGGGVDLKERNYLLNAIVNAYLNTGTMYRSKSDSIKELLDAYPNMAGAIIYPRYEPAEILELAHSGLHVPPGLTRHIVHGRALRINYPLDRLKSDEPLSKKNAQLKSWVQDKFRERTVRYYAESTYLFDE